MADNPWGNNGEFDPQYGNNNYGGSNLVFGQSYGSNFSGNKYSGNKYATKYFNKWSAGGSIASKYIPKISLSSPAIGIGFGGGGGGPFDKELDRFTTKGIPFEIITKDIDGDGVIECQIVCTILLTTPEGTVSEEHEKARKAAYDNIVSVWDVGTTFMMDGKAHRVILAESFNVKLFGTWIGATPPPPPTVFEDLSGGDIYDRNIEDTECVFLLQGVLDRSFVRGDRRTGVFNDHDLDSNVASHEFGHILGLSDRYHYFHIATAVPKDLLKIRLNDAGKQYDGDTTEPDEHLLDRFGHDKGEYDGMTKKKDDPSEFETHFFIDNSNTTTRYVQEGESIPSAEPFFARKPDVEYGTNRNWENNLMADNGTGLTKFQLTKVCTKLPEDKYDQFSFIKDAVTYETRPGKPTFIGLKGRKVIHDDVDETIANIDDTYSLSLEQYGYINPIGLLLNENEFYEDDYSIKQEALERAEYNGKTRREIIVETRNANIDKIEQHIKSDLRDLSGLNAPNSINSPENIPVKMPSLYDRAGNSNSRGRSYWSDYLTYNYYHYMLLQFNNAEFEQDYIKASKPAKVKKSGTDDEDADEGEETNKELLGLDYHKLLNKYIDKIYEKGIDESIKARSGRDYIHENTFFVYRIGFYDNNSAKDDPNIRRYYNRSAIIKMYLLAK